MNKDEIKSLATKIVIMILTALATSLHQDGSTVPAIATDLVDLGTLGYAVYNHWNMKKVPETAKVVV